MTPEEIARVAHEVNRAYCAAIGDFSQPEWGYAPQWQKDSAIRGVEMHLALPDVSPAESHGAWLAEKSREGWRYDPVKSAAAKTHPCMVPFDALPIEQRVKDHLFGAVVRALAPTLPVRPAVSESVFCVPLIAEAIAKRYSEQADQARFIAGLPLMGGNDYDNRPEPVASAKLPNQPVKISR